MIGDRYPFQWPQFYPPQTPNEEMNSYVASLTNENIYDFLRTHFDSSRINIKNIAPEYLLKEDPFGQTMLHWAAVKGDVQITKFIIEKTGVELFNSQTNVNKYTALHLAVHGGNNEVLDLLVDESKRRGLNDFVDIVDVHGQTALHWAVGNGDDKACKKLYDAMSASAIALQIKDRLQTALHFAVQGDHYDIVELLLSKDEVVKELLVKVDKYSQSALHWAAGKPSDQGKELVDLLIKKANILLPDLRKGFFLTRKNEGFTALHIGVHSTSNESVQSLVEATKDSIPEFISAVDEYGQTALHWAAGKGNLTASKCFCNAMKREDINIQTIRSKQTALHFAVQGEHTDVVKLLIQSGVDISIKDNDKKTALDWAQKCQKIESRKAIIILLGGSVEK